MKWQSVELVAPAPATVSVGAKKPVKDLDQKWGQVSGYTVLGEGTYKLEESITGGTAASEWAQVGADITGDCFIELPHPSQFLRVECTVAPGVGKVPPMVQVAGRNQRTV